MKRAIAAGVWVALLLAPAGVFAEADYLDGKFTAFLNLSQPGGGAQLGQPSEAVLVIGSTVTLPKQSNEDWLDDLPTLYGKWKPSPVGGDKGSASGAGNGFKLVSVGGDLGGKSDKCFQLLTPLVGDFSVTCQVSWERAGDDGAKAGLIFREGNDAGAAHVAVWVSHKGEMRLQSRDKAGAPASSRGGVPGARAVVLKLERQGNNFRAAMTPNGQVWTQRSVQPKLNPSGYLGFVVAGKDGKTKATANFHIVSAKGLVTEEGNVVMLEKDEYRTVEGTKVATLTARRVGDGKGALKVPWTAKSGTAQAGKDFVGESGEITWKDGETGPKKFTIPVTNDTVEDKDKTFSVTLEAPESGATLGNKQARVTIIDDDGAGQIRFQSPLVCAPDGKTPMAIFTVARVQGTKGEVDVRYAMRAGTAKAGDKYKEVSGTLTWANGDSKPKEIRVPILWPEAVAANPDDLLVNSSGTKKADPKKPDPKKAAAGDEDE